MVEWNIQILVKNGQLRNKLSWAAITSAHFFEARHGFALHERVKRYCCYGLGQK